MSAIINGLIKAYPKILVILPIVVNSVRSQQKWTIFVRQIKYANLSKHLLRKNVQNVTIFAGFFSFLTSKDDNKSTSSSNNTNNNNNTAYNNDMKEEIEDNLTHLIILAKLAMEKGDTDRAEGILEMGLQIADENKVYGGVHYLYDMLAAIAFMQGKPDKAERILVQAIEKLLQIGLKETDNQILDFKLRLARLYSSYGNDELAELGFLSCLETERGKINAGDVSSKTGTVYINTLFWYGIHMLKQNRLTESKKLLDTAYAFSAKIKGLSPLQEMIILITLSDINEEMGDHERALQLMLNAIVLGKGISSLDLPRYYHKLATIYVNMNAVEQAKDAANEGLRLAKILNVDETEQELETFLDGLKK